VSGIATTIKRRPVPHSWYRNTVYEVECPVCNVERGDGCRSWSDDPDFVHPERSAEFRRWLWAKHNGGVVV
jgi:hypothetical protein